MAGPLQSPGKRFNLRPRTERQTAGKEAFNKQKNKNREDTGCRLTKLIAVRAYSAAILSSAPLLPTATPLAQPKAAEYARTPDASRKIAVLLGFWRVFGLTKWFCHLTKP